MVVTMSGSPSRPRRGISVPEGREAGLNAAWVSPCAPHVSTTLDEYMEVEKQWQEKEMMRAKLLEEEAYKLQQKKERAKEEAKKWRERQKEWTERDRKLREYERDMRSLAKAEHAKRAMHEPGHGPTRWLWPTAHEHPRTR